MHRCFDWIHICTPVHTEPGKGTGSPGTEVADNHEQLYFCQQLNSRRQEEQSILLGLSSPKHIICLRTILLWGCANSVFYFIIFCAWVFCLNVRLCTTWVSASPKGARRGCWFPLRLELQTVVSCYMVTRTWTLYSSSQCLYLLSNLSCPDTQFFIFPDKNKIQWWVRVHENPITKPKDLC